MNDTQKKQGKQGKIEKKKKTHKPANRIISIILCGGNGARLWPLSRDNYPKQFLKLHFGMQDTRDISLLQATYLRQSKLSGGANVYLITGKKNKSTVINQILEVDKHFDARRVFVEPAKKNTAPAITYAVRSLINLNVAEDVPIIVTPADHYIESEENYFNTITSLVSQTKNNIVTIGVTPTRPETGYGYIKKGAQINLDGSGGSRVFQYKEKPNAKTAKEYIKKGYLWNSGVYAFTINSIKNELQKIAPKFYYFLIDKKNNTKASFLKLPSSPFDIEVSEKSKNLIVYDGDYGWSDIGSFDSLDVLNTRTNDKYIGIASDNISVHNQNNKFIATVGVSDLIIVNTKDCMLICKKGSSEKVKQLVEKLERLRLNDIEDNTKSSGLRGIL